ncbi:DUF4249 domain-containing protein [Pontibacter sp. SGAir0037]|uniref:DUF4249 domain-containing protein n=1 Tax=Pontibacter sp. SGAir0037 TaxID=2571030 RepID=UPI00143DF087|nr:DUF4249 domain-containing protein [Pontibacter sp. SGAir0037]
MFNLLRIKAALLFFLFLVVGCEEPYLPKVLEMPNAYLVVSGFINTAGSTTINLSYTQNLYEEGVPPVESGARVSVELEDGGQIELYERSPGIYVNELNIGPGAKCRLKIVTSTGKQYQSEYVEAKQTPAIDRVSWRADSDALGIYVSTHDATNKSNYYSWTFDETWHYTSAFPTNLEYKDGKVTYNFYMEDIYNCWRSENSSNILIGTSTKLTSDVISDYLVTQVPSASAKLGIKYSILVKQRALSKEAFNYYEKLKRNTESIGTLFDPQPSQLTGNISCTSSPEEPVIGFITASTVEEKRLFVSRSEMPQHWRPAYQRCEYDTIMVDEVREQLEGGFKLPFGEYMVGMTVVGYMVSQKSCVDCRVYGTNVRPPFWE